MHSKEEIQKLLDSTQDSRFSGTVEAIKRFFSLSNDVYKVDFSDGRSFVIKIEDPKKINLFTFYKSKALEHIKKAEYGSEIFLYSKNYLEVETYIKSKGLGQKEYMDPLFRANILRNAAEFNSIAFESPKENFWNLIRERKIIEDNCEKISTQIEIYKQKFKLPELSKKSFDWEIKDGLVGKLDFGINGRIPDESFERQFARGKGPKVDSDQAGDGSVHVVFGNDSGKEVARVASQLADPQ